MRDMLNFIKETWNSLYGFSYKTVSDFIDKFDRKLPTRYLLEDFTKLPIEDIKIIDNGHANYITIEISGHCREVFEAVARQRGCDLGIGIQHTLGDQRWLLENGAREKPCYSEKPNGPLGIGTIKEKFVLP